jgi:FkbM family methyltransferase
VPFYDFAKLINIKHPLENGWVAPELDHNEVMEIQNIMSKLSDDISRSHYLDFLFWRLKRLEIEFPNAPKDTQNRFFIPEIVSILRIDETFVDCGAHYGDVILKFIEQVKSNFCKIYAFEPDEKNRHHLEMKIAGLDQGLTDRIHLYHCALGDKDLSVHFASGFDLASRITPFGQARVDQRQLDSLDLRPTFIKMHLEGSELEALNGSMNTISKYRPILAITFYHNQNGIWKIQKWLIDSLNNYQFYIRTHSWGGTGAVIYAIPFERKKHS